MDESDLFEVKNGKKYKKTLSLIDALIKENPDCRIGAVSNGAETLLYV